ncbi:hypothetical protein FMM78_02140 [Bacteroides caecimuris]|nr:hypothetical protein [Bacteroides caecimuris]
MQTINASFDYIIASFVFIIKAFVFINEACVYRLRLTKQGRRIIFCLLISQLLSIFHFYYLSYY